MGRGAWGNPWKEAGSKSPASRKGSTSKRNAGKTRRSRSPDSFGVW